MMNRQARPLAPLSTLNRSRPRRTRPVRVLFVRLRTTAFSVRPFLDESVEIVEARHVAAACTAIQAQPVDLIVVDETLPPWDLHVIHDRVERRESIVVVEGRSQAGAVAEAIEEALHPQKRTPML